FSAPHDVPIGRVVEGRLIYEGPPARRSALLRPAGLRARVAMVSLVVGDGGVVEAFGSGNMPPGAVPAVRRWLDDGKPVVLASRCARGEVTPLYAFEG